MSCLFCRIVTGEIPARRLYEDDRIIAFEDINPQAPLHALVIPKTHVATLNDLEPDHEGLVGGLVRVAAGIAKARGVDASGYRTVLNCNSHAGQTVFHIHLHVLGGRPMGWPPG